VYLKQKQSDDWTRAGSIDLSRGERYRVEMKKPLGLRLVEK
jgi:hypothetical protein